MIFRQSAPKFCSSKGWLLVIWFSWFSLRDLSRRIFDVHFEECYREHPLMVTILCCTELGKWRLNSHQRRIALTSAHRVVHVSYCFPLAVRDLQPGFLGIEKLILSRVLHPKPFYKHLTVNSSDKICYLFWRKHVLRHQNCFIIWKYI